MKVDHLVQGAILAQKQSGGDLLDVVNSDAYRRMPMAEKVDFLHGYAKSNGPEPKSLTPWNRTKAVLGGGASTAAAGGLLGAMYHMSAGGGSTLASASLKDKVGLGSKAVMKELDDDAFKLISRLKTPMLVGGMLGAGAAYLHHRDSDNDKKYIRDSLHNIRTGVNPEANAAALLFNKEKMDKKRVSGFHNEGITSQVKTLKENIYPFGVK